MFSCPTLLKCYTFYLFGNDDQVNLSSSFKYGVQISYTINKYSEATFHEETEIRLLYIQSHSIC